MNAHATGLALAGFAALTTALSHMLLKGGADKLARRAVTGLVCGAGALPIALLVPLPGRSLWWLLAASAALHVIYQLVLIASYRSSAFGAAYPIARGVAPLTAGMGGVALLGERPAAAALAGMALVSLGCVLVAKGSAITAHGLALALLTGALTTLYTLVDAAGVRAAPDPLTFIAWFFLLDAVLMPAIYAAWHGRGWMIGLWADRRGGSASGLASLFGFGAALGALGLAPVGEVSALRETSILIALALAHLRLGEHVSGRQVAGGTTIALGAAAIII